MRLFSGWPTVLYLNTGDEHFYNAVEIILLETTHPGAPLLYQVSAVILMVLISDRSNALECMGVPQKLENEQLLKSACRPGSQMQTFLQLRMDGKSLDPLHAFCFARGKVFSQEPECRKCFNVQT